MNGHMQLRVAFISPDSHAKRTIAVVNEDRSIKIKKSRLPAACLTFGIAFDAADNVVIQYLGDGIGLAFQLGAIPVGQTSSAGAGVSAARTAGCKRHRGEVTCWQPDRGYGFICDTATGESFWFSPERLVYSDSAENLAVGTKVAFVAVGAAKGRKSRQAGAILVVGERADGLLVSQPTGRPHGWVRVEGEQGNRQLVYVPRRELSGCKVGDILTFTVAANDKGSFASRVERLAEDEAA